MNDKEGVVGRECLDSFIRLVLDFEREWNAPRPLEAP